MHKKDQVWFARLDEIAAYVQQLSQAGTWTPRVDRLPYYPGPIPELGEAEPTLAR
jgi:peptidoglycan-N-acetylglucosamine deacetylase